MSLKSFHRVFIVLCLALLAFTAYWASGRNPVGLVTPVADLRQRRRPARDLRLPRLATSARCGCPRETARPRRLDQRSAPAPPRRCAVCFGGASGAKGLLDGIWWGIILLLTVTMSMVGGIAWLLYKVESRRLAEEAQG